jgi:hypothetical protein
LYGSLNLPTTESPLKEVSVVELLLELVNFFAKAGW